MSYATTSAQLGVKQQYPYAEDCPVERITEVNRSLSELRQVIERYDNVVTRLSARLSPVVIPAPPVCTGEANKVPVGYQTDLANSINGLRVLARDITDGLESLLKRIEL
jgi:hypothetical protein